MNTALARELMDAFSRSTGITGTAPPRRYLWTDAFAVGNFLALYRSLGDDHYLQLALRLVDQVHQVLGRHRPDDARSGWISGLSEVEGQHHPTRGGLRIGKKLNERGVDEPANSRLEWDQDGQYFHYLTKWIHALGRVSQETGEQQYWRWAVELAETAHRSFVYTSADGKRMYWKMSIDLRRPLVASMGHHDPLDGLVTCLELTSRRVTLPKGLELSSAIADFTLMCERDRWATSDPLGIGGLLDDAARLTATVVEREATRHQLLKRILHEVQVSLQAFIRSDLLMHTAEQRLAFRELGLSIGLHELASIVEVTAYEANITALVQRVLMYRSLAEQIEAFWIEPAHRDTTTWSDHREINDVMLAASLLLASDAAR